MSEMKSCSTGSLWSPDPRIDDPSPALRLGKLATAAALIDAACLSALIWMVLANALR
jgi:hypothetical protein